MRERPSTTERYTRGLAAAVIAVAALVLAANAVPARAAEPTRVRVEPTHVQVVPTHVRVQHAVHATDPAARSGRQRS
ncbi:hypothetical protein OG604_23945 [Streptomyces sp. NBC_01231]|nr:hypothetical protein OG604_23945 [Streptomyces sp. NBC_01231]